MGGIVKKVTKTVKSAVGGLGHEASKALSNINRSGRDALTLGAKVGRQSLGFDRSGTGTKPWDFKAQFQNPQKGIRTGIKGSVARADADNRALLGDKVGGYVIPVAVDVVSWVNPAAGAALGGAVQYARGAQPRQILGSAAAQYVGGKVGGEVGSATGSRVAGSAAGGFVGGTGSGLAQGKSLGESAKQGAAQGLTAGTLSALNPNAPTGFGDAVTREIEKMALSQGYSNLLGISNSAQQSPTAALTSGFSAINPNASAPNSAGGANITGAPIDISGSDTNAPRKNVWNRASLRVKDALGA